MRENVIKLKIFYSFFGIIGIISATSNSGTHYNFCKDADVPITKRIRQIEYVDSIVVYLPSFLSTFAKKFNIL